MMQITRTALAVAIAAMVGGQAYAQVAPPTFGATLSRPAGGAVAPTTQAQAAPPQAAQPAAIPASAAPAAPAGAPRSFDAIQAAVQGGNAPATAQPAAQATAPAVNADIGLAAMAVPIGSVDRQLDRQDPTARATYFNRLIKTIRGSNGVSEIILGKGVGYDLTSEGLSKAADVGNGRVGYKAWGFMQMPEPGQYTVALDFAAPRIQEIMRTMMNANAMWHAQALHLAYGGEIIVNGQSVAKVAELLRVDQSTGALNPVLATFARPANATNAKVEVIWYFDFVYVTDDQQFDANLPVLTQLLNSGKFRTAIKVATPTKNLGLPTTEFVHLLGETATAPAALGAGVPAATQIPSGPALQLNVVPEGSKAKAKTASITETPSVEASIAEYMAEAKRGGAKPPAKATKDETVGGAGALVGDGDSDMVLDAQRRLSALGYDAGTADGRTGLKTREAVKRFQAAAGRNEDGKVTKALLSDLALAGAGQLRLVDARGVHAGDLNVRGLLKGFDNTMLSSLDRSDLQSVADVTSAVLTVDPYGNWAVNTRAYKRNEATGSVVTIRPTPAPTPAAFGANRPYAGSCRQLEITVAKNGRSETANASACHYDGYWVVP